MKIKPSIKVAFCVSYDWDMLKVSLPLVYDEADVICLALDKDRISWSGNKFEFDDTAFFRFVEETDKKTKIRVYEDDFHLTNLKPMENEVRQRNLMADFMGKDEGWHLQLDADEYFVDFAGFVRYLKTLRPGRKINVCCPWITLYKRIDTGFLMVNPERFENVEFIPIATNAPSYGHGRRNGYFNHYTSFEILHQSWAREPDEVWQKLNNWGHRDDADINVYFDLWKNVNEHNYAGYKNFHQIKSELWPSLVLLPLDKHSPVAGLVNSDPGSHLPLSGIKLRMKNSIWVSRLKRYWGKLR